jgi:threonine dehydrogenase-like Zn-dependent dehydrogenase
MGGGQVLAKVLACGICGSDLHMLVHGEESRRLSAEMAEGQGPNAGSPIMFEPQHDTVMGHEFCCEVLDVGPGVNNLKQGDIVVSFPVTFDEQGVHGIGFSNKYPGGYSERIVINEMMSIKVPNGLSAELAAMTEPLAVGVHAVEKSRIAQGDAAVIIGLGPVGLACIAELKMRGIGPIIGADFSPRRRALAELLGADVVVDPREVPAIEAWRKIDGKKPLVIFEAVGVPGMIEQAMRMAPKDSRILIVGACMQEDHMHPMLGIGKELSLQFVLGYSPIEFGNALTAIAEGKVDLSPLITGRVGIDGVPQAFKDLGDPEQHAKILVMPK